MSQEDPALLTAADLLAQARKTVEISDGRHVVIRRISPADFVVATKGLPDLSALALTVQEATPEKVAGLEEVFTMMGRIVTAALVSPRLARPGEGEPTYQDFSLDDLRVIYVAALEFAGLSRSEAGEVLPLSKTSG
jgi:hypothetical protein